MDFIKDLYRIITEHSSDINKWVDEVSQEKYISVYSSHDIRNSGFKSSAVDANAFPGGFSNLCENSISICSRALKNYIDEHYEGTRNIILLVEEQTRNPYYLENAHVLRRIIENAGFNAVCAILGDEKIEAKTASGKKIELFPSVADSGKLSAGDITPDIIISNNDFSSGEPTKIINISQPILPLPEMGWYRRRKSQHFEIYCHLVNQLGKKYSFDPWLLSGFFDIHDDIDFAKKKGFEEAGTKIDSVLKDIQKKYNEYGIKDKPFVFVKNNSGTYGMAVMTVDSGESFVSMNRTTRNKMSYSKNKVKVSSIIIQEGIPTTDMLDGKVAEPLFYFIGKNPVGGFFRFHSSRSTKQNLNVVGMSFAYDSLCPEETGYFSVSGKSNVTLEKIKVYEFMGILSTLAQSIETQKIVNNGKQ